MASLTLEKTLNRLLLLIRAGYPVIYLNSHEESRVLEYLARVFRVVLSESPGKHLLTWYNGIGFYEIRDLAPAQEVSLTEQNDKWLGLPGLPELPAEAYRHGKDMNNSCEGPAAALKAIREANAGGDATLGDCLAVFYDLHPFLAKGGTQVRNLRNAADELRKYYDRNYPSPDKAYKTVVIVAPSSVDLSPELERDLIVLDFPLPETDELKQTLEAMRQGEPPLLSFPEELSEEELSEEELTRVFGKKGPRPATAAEVVKTYQARITDMIAAAGRGLTMEDYKRGLHMFAVRDKGRQLCFQRVEDMLDLKAKAINNAALQYTPHVEKKIGGLGSVKEWVQIRRGAVLSKDVREQYRLRAPKGVMLCGVSGGGKSQMAQEIAATLNLALLRLDVGALFGKYVGESEENTRCALAMAEVLAPVVLWLDELDKGFGGITGGGDGGVGARVFGTFLTWLAEKQDNVFVVATANNFVPLFKAFPEFARKGRFDEVFWVPLPGPAARKEIFSIYLRKHDEESYIQYSEKALLHCKAEAKIVDPMPAGSNLDRLAWLLSHNKVSQSLTGAEIEYAISEALYRAHVNDTEGTRKTFDVPLIFKAVRNAVEHCLYPQNDPDLTALEAEADRRKFVRAE